jgi:sterol desaturase/sphingolipid hydroxylase (fatty acid hydroxylase superfamily)
VSYLHWLTIVSGAFVVLERLRPWRRGQALLRQGWLRDLGFLVLNGHVFAVLTAGLTAALAVRARELLAGMGIDLTRSPVADWSFPAQLLVYFVVADFLQWSIHVALHRVPPLWAIHKVHHSLTVMDWIGNFHFHWAEILVYKTLQWLPLAWLGAPGDVLLTVAVFTTIWGNFNHSNLDAGLGPLGYVFNSPRMHLWHHDVSDEGGIAKNFAVVLSLWDWIFRTAYWPRQRSPRGLGYPGMEEMPEGLLGQAVWPLLRRQSPVPA